MRTVYVCEKCEARFLKKEDALACEAQSAESLYKVGQKVLYSQDIVEITRVEIVQQIHKFIYMFTMHAEDNPGRISYVRGWRGEEELNPLSINAA